MPKPHQALLGPGNLQKQHHDQEAQVTSCPATPCSSSFRPWVLPQQGGGSPWQWSAWHSLVNFVQEPGEVMGLGVAQFVEGGSSPPPTLYGRLPVSVACVWTHVIWVCVSASSCWSHFSCPVSLSSHRARLFWVGLLIVAPPHYQMSGTCSWLTGSSNYTSVPARIWKARGEGLVGPYKRQTIPPQVPVWEDQRGGDSRLPLWGPKEGLNILKHITVLT